MSDEMPRIVGEICDAQRAAYMYIRALQQMEMDDAAVLLRGAYRSPGFLEAFVSYLGIQAAVCTDPGMLDAMLAGVNEADADGSAEDHFRGLPIDDEFIRSWDGKPDDV